MEMWRVKGIKVEKTIHIKCTNEINKVFLPRYSSDTPYHACQCLVFLNVQL